MSNRFLGVAALAASLAWGADALACGGFFCQSPQQPVDQAAERILFSTHPSDGTVEMSVQVTYTGTASEFAWVLPVPQEPVIGTTVDDVFLNLSQATFPRWNLTYVTEGTCYQPPNLFPSKNFTGAMEDSADGEGGVTVVANGSVGPYDTTTLQATDSAELLDWLQTNGYNIPDSVGTALAPYVADGSFFVALKLKKGADTGDLVPVTLTWASADLTIPLQLTAIAAQPDLRLQPYVLGPARAVPSNYLHVQVNELAIDWLQAGANYPAVITDAANEAGGQAFATDYASTTGALGDLFWSPGKYNPRALDGLENAQDVMNAMVNGSIPISSGTVPFIKETLSAAINGTLDDMLAQNGITEVQLFQCLGCYPGTDGWKIDGTALANSLATVWVPAMQHAQDELESSAWLTRLTSSISADEMTLDPQFVTNPDLPAVDNQHNATLVTECGNRAHTFAKAPKKLVLSDGRELYLPDDVVNGTTPYADYAGEVAATASDRIEQTSASGPATLMVDNRAAIDAAVDALNAQQGCACDTRGGPVGLGGLVAGLLIALRRRR
jgi:hypothetical protein